MPQTEAQKAYQRAYRQRPERKAAMREHKKKWKQDNPEKVNAQARRRFQERYGVDAEYTEKQKQRAKAAYNVESHRRRTYGLTHEQFVEMYARQNGRCAVCRCEILPSGKKTHVDHDHETGQVRGLLCSECNIALGFLKDDPDRIRALAEYVESYRGGDAK